MKTIVLCDIDHVVSDAFWRDAMIGGEGGWDAYHVAGDRDNPSEEVVNVVNALARSGYEVWGLTARPEKWRNLTMQWLVRHGVKFSGLLMRPDGCFDKSPKCKLDLARASFSLQRDIAFLIEDRDDVCLAFRGEGVAVFQCHLAAGVAPSFTYEEGKL